MFHPSPYPKIFISYFPSHVLIEPSSKNSLHPRKTDIIESSIGKKNSYTTSSTKPEQFSEGKGIRVGGSPSKQYKFYQYKDKMNHYSVDTGFGKI